MSDLLRLLRFAAPYWRRSLAALALLAAAVVIDLSIPRLIQRMIDSGINARDMHVVVTTTALMLALSLLQALIAIGNNLLSVEVGERVARDLREELFLRIQAFSFGNLDRLNTGRLMVRLSSDTTAIQRMVQVSLRIGTRAPLLMLGSLVLMFITDARLAWMIVPGLLATAAVIVLFVSRMGPLFRVVQRKLDRLNTVLQENIAGVRVVKAFVRADHEAARFAGANAEYTDDNIRVMHFIATLGPATSVCVNVCMVVVIWAGGLQSIGGGVSVGQLVAFLNYLQTTMGPLAIMVMVANVWSAAGASSSRLLEVLDTVPEVQDPADPQPLPGPPVAIELAGVDFRYSGTQEGLVLAGVNLRAEPGRTIAILGATGSGKSSLVNLIPRFYDATAGRVLWNDTDVRRVRQRDLMLEVGVVPQETVLFSGSVRDNIRFGKPDASEDEVVAAAQAAQAHDFIARLPDGYDTRLEQRGVNLSGGQKQRIAIARALLLEPAILILDDSTSAVDVATETKIQDAIKSSMKDCTCFVVAQRISTVLKADRIVVLDRGRIVAQGTHAEVMRASPVYQEIYASQLGDGVALEEPA